MAFHFVSEVDSDSPDSCVNGSRQERHTPETTTGAEATSFNEGLTEWKHWLLDFEDLTVYKIAYSTVDGKPEVLFMSLKIMVGERGFEPPTPWSRTRF
jgi:hypothetical protein